MCPNQLNWHISICRSCDSQIVELLTHVVESKLCKWAEEAYSTKPPSLFFWSLSIGEDSYDNWTESFVQRLNSFTTTNWYTDCTSAATVPIHYQSCTSLQSLVNKILRYISARSKVTPQFQRNGSKFIWRNYHTSRQFLQNTLSTE